MYMSIYTDVYVYLCTHMHFYLHYNEFTQKKGANGMQVYYKSHARHLLTSVHLYAGTSLHQHSIAEISL